jgi:starch synthase
MSRSRLSIVHLASEMAPLVKVGGLADVVGALAAEQALNGHRVCVALPRYAALQVPPSFERRALGRRDVPWGMGREPASFELLSAPAGPRVLLVDHAGERRFFGRPGVYDDPRTGEGYPDGAERFLFFTRAALEGLKLLGDRVDILHTHDHQAAWGPAFVRTHESAERVFRGATTIFTIHNLGYQGIYDSWVLGLAGFGLERFYPGSPFEFWGRVNYMKVGLSFADALTTVSPRYSREIQENGEFGFGLEGVLRRRSADLAGILNGIDDTVWNPVTDPHLARRYDRDRLDERGPNRARLLEECGLTARPGDTLVGMVTRLVEQKGLDLVAAAANDLMKLDLNLVVLGSGQTRYQDLLRKLAAAHRGRVCYREGFDDPLAHRIEAGADVFLMPSRYEPCGLNQMYSLRYGAVPVVRATGGLADTVEEFDPLSGRGTGFRFEAYEPSDLLAALRRAIAIHRQDGLWRQLQRNGMAQDFSWRASAEKYEGLYRATLARIAASGPPTLESVRALLDIAPRSAEPAS